MTKHNPGSKKALDAGCKCPVMDNNHGKWDVRGKEAKWPSGDWWISEKCKLHWGSKKLGD